MRCSCGMFEHVLQSGSRFVQCGEGNALQRRGFGGFALKAVGAIDTLGCGEHRLLDDPLGIFPETLINDVQCGIFGGRAVQCSEGRAQYVHAGFVGQFTGFAQANQ